MLINHIDVENSELEKPFPLFFTRYFNNSIDFRKTKIEPNEASQFYQNKRSPNVAFFILIFFLNLNLRK